MMRSRTIAWLGAGLALAALAVLASYELAGRTGLARRFSGGQGGDAEVVAAGDMAADFNLEDLTGRHVRLKSLRGKVIFLNVWATWCGPCREEMPSMETLYEDFKNNRDFVMLAVSQDRKGRQAVVPYVEKNGYHFRVLLDPDNQVSDAYNVSGVPETFIIDRTGRIVAHHMGAFDWSRGDVKDALRELIEARNV